MKYQIDKQFLIDCFKEIVSVPSPVGYYRQLNPVLEQYAAKYGKTVTYDNRSTAYITLDGEDNSKTVLVGAHADTIGMVVRKIDSDGKIRVRAMGGIIYSSLEGETVYLCTRDGRTYSGLMACQAHSSHAFTGMRDVPRNEDTMMIILDENVKSKDDVLALGIRPGDIVSAEPHAILTEKGFLKSRYIDDKGPVACAFTMLKYLTDHQLKPKYRTILAFPYSEEVGGGGAFVPENVSEYLAIDIVPLGPDTDCDEHCVVICAADSKGPYDYDLTSRLLDYAEKAGCDCSIQLAKHYSTDANAAVISGNNLRGAAFGMPVYCSHGMERTHMDGLENTVGLMLAYVLDI